MNKKSNIEDGACKSPNDPKLSDGGGWRGPCMAGGKAAAEARAVTAGAVRCSAWLGDGWILFSCSLASGTNELLVATARVARFVVAQFAPSLTDGAINSFGTVTRFAGHIIGSF